MYLDDAAFLPSISRVPNYPIGSNKLILLDPIKFYAILIIVSINDYSPWW